MNLDKTIADKMHKRIEIADQMRGEAITDLKTMRGEAISKHDQTARAAVAVGAKLQDDPENKRLQKEYAGAVNARKMFGAAARMNEAILEQENDAEDSEKTD